MAEQKDKKKYEKPVIITEKIVTEDAFGGCTMAVAGECGRPPRLVIISSI
ncbi:hypothetical protein KKF34_13805 [Myxococcota bacterium]|nr:hypothetical protein [Myxococcota bacterium]MBU1382492.1 hypothetical protein [Myxococcota bacterium]MBU1497946.1 hypothetical protein [Myxococcota bacterium]